jgi:hypothetical protein
MPNPRPEYIPAVEIRRRFAEARILERAASGELVERIGRKDRHPSAPKAQEPFCTRSQAVYYYDSAGQKLAVAHRYLRPDGTIGASGRPDPKYLLSGETVFMVEVAPAPPSEPAGGPEIQ